MGEMNDLLSSTYTLASGATTIEQYTVAVLTSTELEVDNPAAAGAGNIAGVLRDYELAAGETGQFQVAGIAKVKIAEAVAIGDLLVIADTQGRVKPKTAAIETTSGAGIVGRAVSSGTTAGSLVKCILAIPNEFQS